jgi:hypothetical protein
LLPRLDHQGPPQRLPIRIQNSNIRTRNMKRCLQIFMNITQSPGTVSYADALRGPQSPKAGSLAVDIANEHRSSKNASVSRDANDEPQSPQPPKRSANSISFRPRNHSPSRRHINPWITTLQYRVSALVDSIEIAQANALPFRNHADLGEPLPFVMDMEIFSITRSFEHAVGRRVDPRTAVERIICVCRIRRYC